MKQEVKQLLDVQDELGEQKAKLMTELRQSLEFESLLPDVFKHGSIKPYWQVKWDGGWTKSAPIWVWRGKNPMRLVIQQGDVDHAILPEKHVPSFVKRPFV